jgi:glycosyltransferase involved in cell wall biosynthesis
MRVACLVPYPLDKVPGQRFRIEQWARVLAGRVDTEFLPFLSDDTMSFLYKPGRIPEKARDVLAGVARRAAWALRRAHDYDVVCIYREAWLLGGDPIERYLSGRVPTVFDLDDAVWLPNVSASNARFAFLKGFAKVERIMAEVNAVSAGCEYLAAHARKFNPDVFIAPTSIDLSLYGAPRRHEDADVLTVGWTGSSTSAWYLDLVVPMLQRAARRFPIRFEVVGAKIDFPGVDVRCTEWTAETEVSSIRRFDVGIKPAANETWAMGKCPMKDIQYMALGIPVVAQRFGTAVESIADGENGFLCETDDDWVAALDRLRDRATRQRMGAAGRRTVEQRYSAEVAAGKFEEALRCARDRYRPRVRRGRS